MFTDTHCHLDCEEFGDEVPAILQRARLAGVSGFIIPGVHPGSLPRARGIASTSAGIGVACGLHPMLADQLTSELQLQLETAAASSVAVGEIGLDYHCSTPRDLQAEVFRIQLQLALRHNLPVIVHCRQAFRDLAAIMVEEVGSSKVGGVMHAYSGSVEMARELINRGLYLGICGTITYVNAVRPVEVVRAIPLEHLLLETDAPDITPVPKRGSRNEPSLLPLIAGRIAQIKGVAVEEVARITSANAARLFGGR
jgi:TatD DNase family protein